LFAIAALSGLFGIAAIALVWLIIFPHTPDLNPAKAAAIILSTPEFNQSFSLHLMQSTERGTDSMKNCCYTADLIIASKQSSKPINATAEFRWWGRKWHLSSLHSMELSRSASFKN
jgi:hypothetical protein